MRCPHCDSEISDEEEEIIICGNCGFVILDQPFKVGVEVSSNPDSAACYQAPKYINGESQNYYNNPCASFGRYGRYTHHIHHINNLDRIHKCVEETKLVCAQLKLPYLVQIRAINLIKQLLGNIGNDDKVPITQTKVEIVALVFISVRINKSVIVPLRELSVCFFFSLNTEESIHYSFIYIYILIY